MNLLNRLMLWQKLAVLMLVLMLPTALLGALYAVRVDDEVTRARDALDGMRYTKALGALLGEMGSHSSKTREAQLSPSDASRKALADSDQLIMGYVSEIDAADARVGLRFNVSDQWQAIRSQWVDLKTNGARMPLLEAIGRHDRIIEAAMKQVERVALRSGLSRDPDISTFVSVRVAVDDVPRALLAYREVRRYAVYSTQKAQVTEEYATRIRIYSAEVERYLDRAREAMQDTSDRTTAIVQPAVEKAEAAFAKIDAFLEAKYLSAETFDVKIAQLYAAMRETTATLAEVSNVAYEASAIALEERLSQSTLRRNETLAAVALALSIALAMAWLITRSMTKPMAQVLSMFHSIAAGIYDTRVERAGSDEAGQVLQALQDLQQKLHTQGGATSGGADRIKSALDKASTRVLLADESFRIIYANQAMQNFLFQSRAAFRRDLPQLDTDHIVGQSLEQLFGNRGNQRRLVEQSASYATVLPIGSRTLSVATNAITNADGKRVGTMLEVIDDSEARLAAAANA